MRMKVAIREIMCAALLALGACGVCLKADEGVQAQQLNKGGNVSVNTPKSTDEMLADCRSRLVKAIRRRAELQKEMVTLETFAKDAMTPELVFCYKQQLIELGAEIQALQAEMHNLLQLTR